MNRTVTAILADYFTSAKSANFAIGAVSALLLTWII